MITKKRNVCQLSLYEFSGFLPPDIRSQEILFFDIETTGLSPKTSRVFLIGLIHTEQAHTPEMIQLLSESYTDEEERAVLTAFSGYVKSKKYLIHFNGASFDVPYLLHRYKTLGLEPPFDAVTQIDLYRKLMSMPAFFLQMENHRQKTFEALVSYPRKDTLSGKEMIKNYQNYEKTKNSQILDLLFLHNDNDLEGMISLLPLKGLKQLLAGEYEISETKEILERNLSGTPERKLLFTLSLKQSIPARLSVSSSFCYITVLNSTVKIKMPLYDGTLKYFYPDYKNYYYLPFEDEAIHKSIGLYTDSSRRQKAKASNCYKKISGSFVYAPDSFGIPLLKTDYSSKEHYALWPFPNQSPEALKSFIQTILKTAITEK